MLKNTTLPHAGALTTSDINTTVNHEPRILDVRLAEALGFARPRDIRKIIERYKMDLERFGTCASVAHVVRGNKTTEYYLTEKQALYLCTKSKAEKAVDITIQMVKVFHLVQHGQLVKSQKQDATAFPSFMQESLRSAYFKSLDAEAYLKDNMARDPHMGHLLQNLYLNVKSVAESTLPKEKLRFRKVIQHVPE